MKICPKCREQSPKEALFCIVCGKKFDAYTGVTERLNNAPVKEYQPSTLCSGARYEPFNPQRIVASGVLDPAFEQFSGAVFDRQVYHGDTEDVVVSKLRKIIIDGLEIPLNDDKPIVITRVNLRKLVRPYNLQFDTDNIMLYGRKVIIINDE